MDPWKADDVVKFKRVFQVDFKQVEKALYDPLAEWIGNNQPGTIYLDHIDASALFQGIGQAIWYLRRGMDYSYLVVPLLADLPYFTELFSYATKYVGLIVFDRKLEFQKIRDAEKAPYLDYSARKLVLELLAMHRSGPANLRLRRIKEKWASSLNQ